jgi:hypothetical protein
MGNMQENKDDFDNESSEITELDIWFETAELYFQLEAEKRELESIIKSIRDVLDTDEDNDFKLSKIDTILFGWR